MLLSFENKLCGYINDNYFFLKKNPSKKRKKDARHGRVYFRIVPEGGFGRVVVDMNRRKLLRHFE